MFWLLDKPFFRATTAFWLLNPAAQRPSRWIPSVFSWLLLLAGLLFSLCYSTENTHTFTFWGKSPSQYIWLTEIWLSQTGFCVTQFMWWAFVWGAVGTRTLVCVKGSYLSVNGRSSMLKVLTCTRAKSSYWFRSSTGANLVQVLQVCPHTKRAPFFMVFEGG